jgi:outer membrane receptor protein involved in Fe transport
LAADFKKNKGFTFVPINGILYAMKKTIIFLSILLLVSILFPRDAVKIGAYTGYFSPADENLKEIYKGEDFIYGLKLGVRIWREFYLWLSGMQFKKMSETTLLSDITTLTLQPITLSLRYTFDLGALNPYFEGGYTYIFFREESDIGNVDGEGKGFLLDAGIELKLSSRFVIDLGVRYTQAEVRPTGFDVQLGGVQAGISLVIVF